MAAQEKNMQEIEKAKKLNHVPWGEEYEKMISGMLYDSWGRDLTAARYKARAFAHKYNTWFPPPSTDPATGFDVLAAERAKMLKEVIGHLGDDVFIEPPFNIDYGCNISIGPRFFANFNLTILDCSLVTIGARCMFGPNVSIFAATHETEVQSRRDNIEYGRPVVVGDDCWIGGNVVILPGVTIGRGVTVAAMSVVTKDVPDFSVVMGQPAKVVKKVKEVEGLEGDVIGSS
ncbi:galactoside O-acetyltransferase [Bipolaris maydis]|uniref:galactoside O-acetyltransferase n=1 Tax=Cochliobolus heterostrophus TaxID=5016 RepID=UPI0024D3F696|nr:galactoside O-acetyltransferase [Bipolaris maydis]KAJ6196703.1 galactoside O-acetyltransferase [Bipolaris maydis]KAJ6207588.1 galactoside O-acetyltransferase [Bipolaris maydis]KAJ6269761.1 galactoside O-acetyltransferase [Bipolaris maydis]KAJ6280429.1 galactoside O-acetyltransferase [Bipolaris maydis]